MKKTIKLLVIIDFCLFISFTLGGIILEILRAIPFSKGVAFDVVWHILFIGTYITLIPLLIIIFSLIIRKNNT